ncbi:MAG: energy-coupling factor transporter ATPase [Ruminococcaceae bacterium]|nr:energy-coupling factor transporter ATPase [Oscillospiraceae bacterium]
MNDYIIKCENLGFTYSENIEGETSAAEEIPALKNITLGIKRGEYLAVLGHNGSGKSTLAKLLNMILTPTVGKIYIDGVDITAEDFTEDDVFAIRRKIGMVFQNPDNQLVATVVEEDVAFGPENLGLPREEIRRRVNSSLALVGMQNYMRHAPHKLSGGQKQRVAIAGIIAMKPEVIIFDESTAMLDPLGRREVIEIMERLNREEGITVINITHYMEEAARADRVVVINDGELALDGTPKKVFSKVARLHSMGLEAPQGNELVLLLRDAGCRIDGDSLTEEECVETLYNFISKEKTI